MVAYALASDLSLSITDEAMIRTTDENSQAPVSSVVERAISDAQAMIDSYLIPAGYAAPFGFETSADVPPMLRKLTVDIATYFLYARTNEEMTPDNVRRINYDQSIRYLLSVQAGAASFEAPRLTTTESDDAIVYRNPNKMFPDNLERYL